MAWFGINKKNSKQVIPLMNGLIQMLSMNNGGDLGTQNKQALNKIFGRSPYYKMLVDKRGRDVARVKLYLKDLDSKDNEKITEHELLDLLNKPNSEMIGMQFRKLTQVYYDNIGEWVWWLARDVRGNVIEIFPMNPADITVRGSKNEKWQFNNINGVQYIDNKDIIYCRDINPAQPYGRGIGQGQATSDELSIAEKIMKLIGVTFDNKAVPPFIINFKGVSETEVEAAQSKWLTKFKGIANYAKPMFTNADIDIKKLAYNFEETKIVELGEMQRNQFREIWGIPKELIGDLGSSNKASSTNAWNIYAENVVIPNIDIFIQVVQYSLIKEYNEKNNTNLELCYKNPNKADEEFILKAITSNPFAFVTNEIRALAHHDEWEDERGKQIFVPLNFTSSNGNSNRETPVNNDMKTTDTEEKISLMGKKNLIKEEEEEPEEMFGKEDLLGLMVLLGLMDIGVMRDELINTYLFVFQQAGDKTLKEFGLETPFIAEDQKFNDYMQLVYDKSLLNMHETLSDGVRELLQESVKNNATKKETKAKLQEILDKYTKGYALERIVETEATATVNNARLVSAQQSGIDILKEWLTQKDNKVRKNHLIDGQTKPLNSNFVLVNGNLAMYPGDPNLPPEDRVNERCFLAFNNGYNSLAGIDEEQKTAYWNNQRAEIEEQKNTLRESYKNMFGKLENSLNDFFK